jgi:ABC-2 type transport system permease protein
VDPPRLGRVTAAVVGAPGSPRRYFHSLWLLSARDLRVRYSTSALGYLWSVLDPLVMSAIYWFVFTQVFQRGDIGASPYIVFLITGLLPWLWFNSAVSDLTKAFKRDSRLVRSTSIPRSIWVNRIVLSKGVEFALSLPVLAAFAALAVPSVELNPLLLLFPVGIVLQATLLVGLGMLIAPLCALWGDLERTTRLVLRALFYASPIIYGLPDLPAPFREIAVMNPLSGIFSIYRAGLFPGEWDTTAVLVSAVLTALVLALGIVVFRRLEPAVLKEL